VYGEEGQQSLRLRVLPVTSRAQAYTAGALHAGVVGAGQGVRKTGDKHQGLAAPVAWKAVGYVNLDTHDRYDATAIPGMLFSSPSSAEETLTENRSTARAVSRFL
jgi:hypothetical protein